MLSFPLGSTDILSFLSDLSLSAFLENVEGKQTNGNDWLSFHPVCSKNYFDLSPNESIQYQFKTFEIEIHSYEIKTGFNKWSLLGSSDSVKWITIHSVDENANFGIQILDVENIGPFFFLQIRNEGLLGSPDEFEIFGTMKMKDQSIPLKRLTKIVNPILNPQSIYSFSLQQDWGLITFFLSLSAKENFHNFGLFETKTHSNSSLFILVRNEDSIWFSTNESGSSIEICFWNNWRFHPSGFKFKSGFRCYPQSFKIIERDSNYHRITIAEFKDEDR